MKFLINMVIVEFVKFDSSLIDMSVNIFMLSILVTKNKLQNTKYL